MSKGTTIPASSTNAEESQRLTEGPFKALGYRPKDSADQKILQRSDLCLRSTGAGSRTSFFDEIQTESVKGGKLTLILKRSMRWGLGSYEVELG